LDAIPRYVSEFIIEDEMNFLAQSTTLGVLEVLEVYVQYNGPRLLACKNQVDKIFLALWVDEEEDSDLWLYMLISPSRLQSIRTGQVSLHDAFSKPELDYFYELVFTYEDASWSMREVSLDEIDEDCFPLKSAVLSCDPTSSIQVKSETVNWSALEKKREVVCFVLEPESIYPHEFSVLALGRILSTFQPLLTQLKVLQSADLKIKTREIVKKSEFNVFATSPGSFRIEMASTLFECDVFGNSFAGDAIASLFQLVQIGSDTKLLQDFMSNMDNKTATKYRLFLESFISSETGLKIEWGSPTLTRGGSVEVNLSSIHETLKAIKKIELVQEREISITGELFKMDKNGWRFGIKDLRTEKSYSGDILDQAKKAARTATISMIYSAKILEIPELIPVSNTVKTQYKLLALDSYEPSDMQMSLVGAS
jgi:hypothetical protein